MTLRPAPAPVLGGILQPVQDQAAQDPKGRALIGSLPSSSHALQKGQLVCSSHSTHCQVVQAQVHAHAAVRPREAGLHAALLEISGQTQPWGVCAIVFWARVKQACMQPYQDMLHCPWQRSACGVLL